MRRRGIGPPHFVPAIIGVVLLATHLGAPAFADAQSTLTAAPAFDRPGIAFSTSTLPAGTFALEQGIPDMQTSSRDEDSATIYSADVRFRAAITDSVEVQAATSLFNTWRSHESGRTETADGHGDLSLALKVALPASRESLSWATLVAVTVANGANRFTNGDTAYDAGIALGDQLSDDVVAEMYVHANRLDGSTSVDVSPNLNVTLTQSLGAFVEAGATFPEHGPNRAVAGGGFTLFVTPAVQLDLSADFGLTSDSPRVLAGFGVSVFFK